MINLPTVTKDNYFSTEINQAYMSHSQYLAFQRCEAAALAEIRGDYIRPVTTAMLVGSYVDAYFEGTLDSFSEKHPELFKRDGTLKSDFSQAKDIIKRMEADKLYMLLMSGKKQVIRTGSIAGVPFKIKIDSLLDASTCKQIVDDFPDTTEVMGLCDGAIVDQKVMRSLDTVWDDFSQCRVSFAEAWGYDVEGAIYQAIEGHMLPFILAVGTKEATTNLEAIYIPDQDLEAKLHEIEDTVPRYQAIKNGDILPVHCGHCDYCKAQKRLFSIRHYKDIL